MKIETVEDFIKLVEAGAVHERLTGSSTYNNLICGVQKERGYLLLSIFKRRKKYLVISSVQVKNKKTILATHLKPDYSLAINLKFSTALKILDRSRPGEFVFLDGLILNENRNRNC